MPPLFPVRTLATLLAALLAALACSALQVPLPWMIGPLLVTALASMAGAPTHSWTPLRNAGQWAIGTALGLYFTPEVAALMLRMGWVLLLAVAWALVLGLLFAAWLYRGFGREQAQGESPDALRATCYFSGAIGGASEMTLLAERFGARTDLVAAAHSVRVLIVTVLVPVAVTLTGLQGLDPSLPSTRSVSLPGLAVLGAATLAGALGLSRLRAVNPWFIGSLAVAVALTVSGLELSALPAWLTNAGQLVIGVSLGVRFRAGFLRLAPAWLARVAAGTVVMIGLSAGFSALLSLPTGLNPVTLVLATAPGGIAEMAITAKVLQLGVPVVTAFQVCRLVVVLVLVGPLYRWITRAPRTPR